MDDKNLKILLERGVEEVIEKEHLETRLKRGDKLRVKLGIDPTAKDLHLGHTVALRKLRQFQDAGHQAVFIIGDYTAMIGDPSGRSDLRPILTEKQIKENMQSYLKEAGKVINIKKAEVRHNSEWYKKKGPEFLMELTSKFTVARMLERDDFQKRLKNDVDISILEILYPILQGYDSLEVKADLELGGTDQKFNLLTGRKVQRRYGQAEQDIMTVPIIEGLDGVKKMSKSLGNYIGLSDEANDMFGKVMSLPDALMVKYFTLLTDVSGEEVESLRQDRLNPSLAKISPKEWKQKLGFEIVKMYHNEKEAEEAKEEFEKVFSRKELPTEIAEYEISEEGMKIEELLLVSGAESSTSAAKRSIEGGAVEIDDQRVERWGQYVKKGSIVKDGKKFIKTK